MSCDLYNPSKERAKQERVKFSDYTPTRLSGVVFEYNEAEELFYRYDYVETPSIEYEVKKYCERLRTNA